VGNKRLTVHTRADIQAAIEAENAEYGNCVAALRLMNTPQEDLANITLLQWEQIKHWLELEQESIARNWAPASCLWHFDEAVRRSREWLVVLESL
jgi:hypothetical protein